MKNRDAGKKRSTTAERVAHLISNASNIRYLTGFVGAAPTEHEAYVILYRGATFLLTNSLYLERAHALAQKTPKMSVIPISRTRPLPQVLAEFSKKYRLNGISLEAHDLTLAEYRGISAALGPSVQLTDDGRTVELKRMIKSPLEMTRIRKAARITDACFLALLPMIRPGIPETELAFAIDSYFRSHNAVSAFPPIIAFGAHTSQPHYIPQPGAKLTKQSLVLIDFGAAVDGYASDMTRMVYVGTPPEQIIRAYNAVSLAQKNALLYLSGQKPCHGGKADSIARATIRNMGFPPYTHSLGHAVGLDIHESPRLTVHDDQILKPGMVFSVEPGMYLEGKFGIRIEDLVTLTAKGLEILSKTRKDLLTLKR